MQNGDEYGELYGDAVAEIETHQEDAIGRMVYAIENAANLKKLFNIFTLKIQELENIYRGITPTLLFNIETAYGQQLDQLGSFLRLPREGWDDDLYRIYLRTQELLVLPKTRTQARLIQVVRSLLDDPNGNVEYAEFRPKSYLLGVPGVDLEVLVTWIRFLERCRPATYNAQILWLAKDAFGYDDASGTIVTTVKGYSDATNTIIAGGPYSAVIGP